MPSSRANFFYLEHCRVHVHGGRVVYGVAEGGLTKEWNIPAVNTYALMLGTGCSISQAAVRRLAEERVMLCFTGTGGTPVFMGDLGDYAPTEYLIKWIAHWHDPTWRLQKAIELVETRCANVERFWNKSFQMDCGDHAERFRSKAKSATTIDSLRGFEGEFAKGLYAAAAKQKGIAWTGRQAGVAGQDMVNGFLDQGNYLAYGIAAVTLWTLGLPACLAVNHGASRAGGLVFDLADTFKDALVLPVAFDSAALKLSHKEFREKIINLFDEQGILPKTFATLKGIVGILQ